MNRLIFFHINRTGGKTARRIFVRNVRKNGKPWKLISNQDSLNDFERSSPADKESLALILGHMPFGLHTRFASPCIYVTMLRDPVQRVISHYYTFQKKPFSPIVKMSLEDFARSNLNSANNLMVRSLLAHVDDAGAKHNYLEKLLWGSDPLDTDALERAKRLLRDHFAVVGITERFDEMLLVMRKMFGWRHMYYRRVNVRKTRPEDTLSPEILDCIRSKNSLDLELYSFACGLFEESLRASHISPRELARFRFVNSVYNKYYSFYEAYYRICFGFFLGRGFRRYLPRFLAGRFILDKDHRA